MSLFAAALVGICLTCRRPGVTQDGRCLDCQHVHEWSRVNRAFCQLLHVRRPPDVEALLARLWG
jgi:hypothetical protein